MNERINQLAEQAGLRVYSDGEIGPAYFGSVDAGYRKFAEVIIEECVGVVMGGSFLHDEAPGAQFARECSAAIKRHFKK